MTGGLTRRRMLELGAGVAAGATLGGGGVAAATQHRAEGEAGRAPQLPFDGPGAQQGITTPRPRHLALAAFDVAPELVGAAGRRELAGVLRDWSTAGRALVGGAPVPEPLGQARGLGAPADTGEASGLGAAGLTLTFAFGAALFDPGAGLVPAGRRPAGLQPLPHFAGDALEERWSGGAVLVAAAADDGQVALHAVRNLARIGKGAVALRWTQRGFLPGQPSGEPAPRNLLGFHDGVSMLDHRDPETARRYLWAAEGAPPWMHGGGTFLVVRRIRMLLEPWDRTALADQEATIGRRRADGGLLGAARAAAPGDAPPAVAAGDGYGDGASSHVAVARAASGAGHPILRRPYSYADGVDPATGELDAGLLFLAFQRSVGEQFVPLQARLAAVDALRAYVQPIGSAVFAVPPASRGSSDWVGSGLLA